MIAAASCCRRYKYPKPASLTHASIMDRGFAPGITRREGELTQTRVSAPPRQERSAGAGDYTNFYLGSVTVAGALAGPADGSPPEQ